MSLRLCCFALVLAVAGVAPLRDGAQGVAVVSLWLCCFVPVPAVVGVALLRGGAPGVVVVVRLCCLAPRLLLLCSAPGPAAAGVG